MNHNCPHCEINLELRLVKGGFGEDKSCPKCGGFIESKTQFSVFKTRVLALSPLVLALGIKYLFNLEVWIGNILYLVSALISVALIILVEKRNNRIYKWQKTSNKVKNENAKTTGADAARTRRPF